MTFVKSHKKNVETIFLWRCSEMLLKPEFWRDGYCVLHRKEWWGIFKEYLKQNIIMAVLRKANAHSVVIYRLIKKSIIKIKKIDPRGKIDSNFFTPQKAVIAGNSRQCSSVVNSWVVFLWRPIKVPACGFSPSLRMINLKKPCLATSLLLQVPQIIWQGNIHSFL